MTDDSRDVSLPGSQPAAGPGLHARDERRTYPPEFPENQEVEMGEKQL
jgi:hypothetical protein